MFKFIDDAAGLILRLAFEGLETFLLFTLLALSWNKAYVVGWSFPFTLVVLVLSYGLNKRFSTLGEKEREESKRYVYGGIAVALLAGFMAHPQYGNAGKIIMSMYYLYTWIRGVAMVVAEEKSVYYAKRFIRTLAIGFVISISIGIGSWALFRVHLQGAFGLFVVLTILYMVRLNMKDAFGREGVNVLTQNRHLLLVNVASVLLMVGGVGLLFAFFVLADFSWFGQVLGYLLTPLLKLGTLFSLWAKGRFRSQMDKNDQLDEAFDRVQESTDPSVGVDSEMVQPYEESTLDVMVEWGFYLLLIALLVGLLYWMQKQIRQSRKGQGGQAFEYKESMVSATYLRQVIRDRLSTVNDRVRRVFGSHLPEEPVRRLYAQFLHNELKVGRYYAKFKTANDINEEVQVLDQGRPDIEALTDHYNRVRYGESVSREDQEAIARDLHQVIDKRK